MHQIWRRTGKQPNEKIWWTGDTKRTILEVHNTVEDDTTRGMPSSLYPYIGRNPKELVYRPVDAHRHYIMDRLTTKLCSNFLIWTWEPQHWLKIEEDKRCDIYWLTKRWTPDRVSTTTQKDNQGSIVMLSCGRRSTRWRWPAQHYDCINWRRKRSGRSIFGIISIFCTYQSE